MFTRGVRVERLLHKLAKQLLAFDEASLANLWEKYAEIVTRFEPTRQWEEAVIVLCMIQGVRNKNQLFNLHWSEGKTPAPSLGRAHPRIEMVPQSQSKASAGAKPKGKVLAFKPGKEDEPAP